MYVTSGDDQVFAVNGDDRRPALALRARQRRDLQELRHRRQPRRRLLRRQGLPAHARHDDRRARPEDRASSSRACRSRAPSRARTSNYGYSETSAPICANHTADPRRGRLRVRRPRLRDGLPTRDLTPAWANPFWTIPPNSTEWRKAARLVGGCTVWTPRDRRPDDEHALLRHCRGVAGVLPVAAARARTRAADSLVAVDLATGKLKWWQQQLVVGNQWSYDTAQPPLVYTTKIGGKTIATSSRWRRWKASGSPSTRRRARRSTSA